MTKLQSRQDKDHVLEDHGEDFPLHYENHSINGNGEIELGGRGDNELRFYSICVVIFIEWIV
jgi:hypothetical protein